MAHAKRAPLTPSQKFTFFVIIFIVAIAIPLTLWSTLNVVNISPRAAGSGSTPATNTHSPSLQTSSLLNTLNCQINEPCTATFVGTDADRQDVLTLDVDFLPPPLTQQTCQPNQALNQTTISCGISGTPTQPGQYLIQISLSDKAGHTIQKTLTLNIK